MRRLSRHLTLLAGAIVLLGAGAASAQTFDAPVSTAGSSAGGAPVEADPATVHETPAPPPAQPARDLSDLEAAADHGRRAPLLGEYHGEVRDVSDLETAADHGRRAPLLGEYHGEVGGVVGTNGLRGAYGRIVARPNDHVALDFRFSTIHQNGYPYGGGVYDRYDRYRPDTAMMAPDPMIPPGN